MKRTPKKMSDDDWYQDIKDITPLTKRQVLAQALINKYPISCLYGGSRSGKTFTAVYYVVARALMFPNTRHAIARRYRTTLLSIYGDTFPVVAKTMDLVEKEHYSYNKKDMIYTFKNGSTISLIGLDNNDRVEKVLGFEYSTIYLNEASQMEFEAVTISLTRLVSKNEDMPARLIVDYNPPNTSHWTYKYFEKKIIPGTKNQKLKRPKDIITFQMNIEHNDKMPEDYIEKFDNFSDITKKRFLLGEYGDDGDKLWSEKIILWTERLSPEELYSDQEADLREVIVAVDPAVTSKKNSDATGIVVVGRVFEDCYMVLDDFTVESGTPEEWMEQILLAARMWNAETIFVEKNQGGDLITTLFEQIVVPRLADNEDYDIITAHASVGKMDRALPASALYVQNRVFHNGRMYELEEEMLNFSLESLKTTSPDRVDALVWGLNIIDKREAYIHETV